MAEPNQNTNQQTEPNNEPSTASTGAKTFSEDYVHALREESKGYRLSTKKYEDAFKNLLNVDNLDDLDVKIKSFTDANQRAIDDANSKTNKYIIDTEFNKLLSDNYNEKLAKKIVDLSKVTVTDGKVSGLKEALEAAEKEYPEIKKTKPGQYSGGAGTGGTSPAISGVEAAFLAKNPGLKI